MRGKKYLWALMVLMFLASIANVSIPTTFSQEPTVTFKVDPPITTGVPVGDKVAVNVSIEADPGAAIVGWMINLKVDPDVLVPSWNESLPFPPWIKEWLIRTSEAGYFLHDWCVANGWDPEPGGARTIVIEGSKNVTTGMINGTAEYIKKWAYLGVGNGSDGTGNLATFYFTSKNETAWSPIEIVQAYYCTSFNPPDNPDYRVPDLIINGHYNQPAHDVAVTDVTTTSFEVNVGEPVTINVTVTNEGGFPETVNVTVSYDTTIDTKIVTLDVGESKTEQFMWNTTSVPLGIYPIMVEASVAEDDDPTDNTLTTEWGIEIVPEFPILIPLLLTLAILAVFTIVLKRRRFDEAVDIRVSYETTGG